jgi:hypothetical protein
VADAGWLESTSAGSDPSAASNVRPAARSTDGLVPDRSADHHGYRRRSFHRFTRRRHPVPDMGKHY